MRKRLLAVFAVIVFLSLGYNSFGDEAKKSGIKDKKECSYKDSHKKKRAQKTEKKLKMFTSKLELTAEQQTQVKEILLNSKDKVKELWNETKSRSKEIRKSAHDQIGALLTPEQKEKFKSIREKCERSDRGQ